jgi:pimeloyl-ACP methyl ester carboxylesterase
MYFAFFAAYDFFGFDQRNFGLSSYPYNKQHGLLESWS